MMPVPLEILCCYALNDQQMLEHLIKGLKTLERQDTITIWSKMHIKPGENSQEEFDRHLASADIILLLISGDSIASDNYHTEIGRAIERHHTGRTRIIPILLNPSHWREEPFAQFQVLPKNEIPITDWPNLNAAFFDITKEIIQVVATIQAKREQELAVKPVSIPKKHSVDSTLTTITVPFSTPVQLEMTDPPITPIFPGYPLNPAIPFSPPNTPAEPSIPLSFLARWRKRFSQNKRRSLLFGIFAVLLLLTSVIASIIASIIHMPAPPILATISQHSVPIPGGESVNIGMSDGSFLFHTQSELNAYGMSGEADGESCIYNENQQILTSQAHLTVVAVVSLSDTKADHTYSFGLGNATLQGFCQKQIAYNNDPANTVKVRILVANIGVQSPSVLQLTMPIVTKQIIQLAQQDKTFIGTVGFTYSASLDDHNFGYTIDTMNQLKQAGIPAISTAAATSDSDFASQWAGYFYRMNPGNDVEADVSAHYAYYQQHKRTVFVFYDSSSTYSLSLETSFIQNFQALGGTANTTDIQNSNFQPALASLSTNPPDMIFCACVASSTSPDFSIFAQDLQKYPNLSGGKVMVMGADGLFNPEGKDIAYRNMFFTALAFPDMIHDYCTSSAQCSSEQIQFYQNYCQTFDPGAYEEAPGLQPTHCSQYGLSRPGKSTMLSYDALTTLLLAYDQRLATSASLLDNVRQALPTVNFQGITGWIQLSKISSNPIHKMILVISVNDRGLGHTVDYCGEFTPAVSNYALSPQQDC